MDSSTGLVAAATGIVLLDLALSDWDNGQATRIVVAGVLAAWCSVGLNKLAEGFGTGAGALLVFAAVFNHGPSIFEKLNLGGD